MMMGSNIRELPLPNRSPLSFSELVDDHEPVDDLDDDLVGVAAVLLVLLEVDEDCDASLPRMPRIFRD